MIKPQFKIDKRFLKKLKAKFGSLEAEAGILKDKPYKRPRPKSKGMDSLNGRPVRKKSRITDGTVGKVSERIRKDHVNYLRAPFQKPNSKDIREMKKSFFDYIQRKGSKQKAEMALQQVIRNPIWKRAYGKNAASTRRSKGFDWKLVDTAQFFKNIIARLKRNAKGRNV